MFGKNQLRGWLSFSRKDRIGLLVVFLATAFVWVLPRFFRRPPSPPIPITAGLRVSIDSLERRRDKQAADQGTRWPERTDREPSRGELFPFDPNRLDEQGWIRLGLRPKTAATILKYRSKGGRFRRPEDLQKIWGLPPGFYERVSAYIRLGETASAETDKAAPRLPVEAPAPRPPRTIEINSADSAAWETLPGIGPTLASRIIAFRNRLGGFHSIMQVREVYGLRDSTFQLIESRLQLAGGVKTLAINSASVEELKDHPYLRWNGAKAIVAYRKQHGPFGALEELKKISLIDETLFEKLRPYLRLD